MTTAERAKDLKQAPIYILGAARGNLSLAEIGAQLSALTCADGALVRAEARATVGRQDALDLSVRARDDVRGDDLADLHLAQHQLQGPAVGSPAGSLPAMEPIAPHTP